MKINKSILTNNDCYKTKRTIKVKGLMLHSVGVPQPNAKVFVKNWNKSVGVCVHGFIDGLNGEVYQTLPWNHRAWHCGDSGNNTHIGIEMCEPDTIRYGSGASFYCTNYPRAVQIVERTYNTAVELFAYLCEQYNLDPMTDIISHKEGSKKGIASNHSDPEHLWKGLGTGFTMDTFRKDVKAKMKGTSYTVLITTASLNVRTGPGMSYAIVTQVHRNEVYTIVEKKNNWGKLKSGAGWIYLPNYTKKA